MYVGARPNSCTPILFQLIASTIFVLLRPPSRDNDSADYVLSDPTDYAIQSFETLNAVCMLEYLLWRTEPFSGSRVDRRKKYLFLYDTFYDASPTQSRPLPAYTTLCHV
jgi:hypothetical protein